MPQFYGSQRLFWYLIVAVTLNGASLVILTYFLVERAKAGSTAVWHFFAVFERCLPAWWKEKRLEAERESVAQLVRVRRHGEPALGPRARAVRLLLRRRALGPAGRFGLLDVFLHAPRRAAPTSATSRRRSRSCRSPSSSSGAGASTGS